MKLARVKEGLPKWKSALLAVAGAILLVLAFPDFGLWYLAWIALVPLLWAVEREKESIPRALLTGWIFGTTFFFGSCWWLTYAPITYAGFPALLAYFLFFCVAAAAGIFPGMFAAVLAFLQRRFGSVAMLAAPFLWVATEFARYWITGNNWNALGYSQAFYSETARFGAYGGVLLVSFLLLLGNSLLAYWLFNLSRYFVLVIAAVFFLFIAGVEPGAPDSFIPVSSGPVVAKVLAIQPNVPMSGLTYDKWQALRQRHVRLAEAALSKFPRGSNYWVGREPERLAEEKAILDVLDHFAANYSIDSLRNKKVLANTREVRIWVGFGPDITRGLVLRNDHAEFLPPLGEGNNSRSRKSQIVKPSSGAGSFWSEIEEAGLLEFPKEPKSEWVEPRNDSNVVVVEVRNGEDYQYVVYGAPCNSKGLNATKLTSAIANIGEVLGTEFFKCHPDERSNAVDMKPTIVIFPESPMNFMYETDAETRAFIDGFAARNNVSVIFNSAEPDGEKAYFNSAVMVGPGRGEIAQYDKIFLLPFGESVPAPLRAIVPAFVGSFSYGSEYDLLPLGDAKGGVMICFESHFGDLSREYVRNGADVLIEMTNDGYLGPTPVLRQHLANAVFRAVETNRPVLRATNVGITAYINERGEVIDPAPSYTEDVRVWSVARSDGSQTLYVRWGDWFAWVCVVVTLGLLVFGYGRQRRQTYKA
jgi:apolipoprotein N-acyltransferase